MAAFAVAGLSTVPAAPTEGTSATLDAAAVVHRSPTVPGGPPVSPEWAQIPLYSDGVVVDVAGMPAPVPVGEAGADHVGQQLVRARWLAEGRVPGPARFADLAVSALRDLDALVLPGGAAIAGTSERWRYVWPRDASFVAAALARTGHPDDALAVLAHLADLQAARSTGGVFEARYVPDGSGDVPDARGTQLDGNGWVLWAVGEWYAQARPGSARSVGLERLRHLVVRSVAAIRANVDPTTGLPAVSADYWEVDETRPTLGTAAALLLGLRGAGPVLRALGEAPADDLVALLEGGIDEHFAPDFGRYPGEDLQDTAVAFLMPPFAPPDRAVEAAWRSAATAMARPAGGLAPGAAWRTDGVSWTPTTALFALTAAASGDRATAVAWLTWLDAHRTTLGALPEKVLGDGSPSAVAPLAWTCALVLLTLDELDRLDELGDLDGGDDPGAIVGGRGQDG